ncbi:MAG: hypothetical protein WDZ62_01405, partial [Candidatus Pacearchaeota archaeon]
NTLVMGFSFISLYLISRTRTGAAVAINELVGSFSIEFLILILFIVVLTGIISFFATLEIGKIFSRNLPKIDYVKTSKITLAILTLIILFVSGISGIIVFGVSTITGIFCINTGVKRTHMMGCLLIPTIIFYLML